MNATTRAESVVGFALLALLFVIASVTTDVVNPDVDLRASTFSNERSGLRALYLVLEECGVAVSRRTSPLDDDLPADVTLVLAGPSQPLLDDDVSKLLDFVARGGRLVVVDQPPFPPAHTVYTAELLSALDRCTTPRKPRDGVDHDGFGSALPRTYEAYAWDSARRIEPFPRAERAAGHRDRDPRTGGLEPLIAPEGETLAEQIAFGDAGGQVVLVADTVVFDNAHLGVADNALLAVDLLTGGAGASARVVFDEFHHGFRDDGERGDAVAAVRALLAGTWPGRAALLLAVAGLVALLGRAPRFGAPDAPPRTQRRALTEHTDALGDLYRAARARGRALTLLASGTRRVIAARAGLPATLPPTEFDRRLARSSAPGASDLAAALAATRDDHGSDDDLALARRARALTTARRRFVRGEDHERG